MFEVTGELTLLALYPTG